MMELVTVSTDWWSVSATIFTGVITAASTIGAVLYTNYRTKKQLVEQEMKFSNERKEESRQTKFITIQHKTLLKTFNNLLDSLIMDNDYYRTILFSGKDGFEFYDDFDKRSIQFCRIFLINNPGQFEIKDVEVKTFTRLTNLDNDKDLEYQTSNVTSILRSRESIVLRLANEEQWKNIIELNKINCTNELVFSVIIAYTTEALQRITYEYNVKILNDKKFEILQDGITSVENIDSDLKLKSTVFRNLQDSIAGVDRASYIWEKQGQAQMKGLMNQYNLNNPPQQSNVDETNDVQTEGKGNG